MANAGKKQIATRNWVDTYATPSLTETRDKWYWRERINLVEKDLMALSIEDRIKYTIISEPVFEGAPGRRFAAVGVDNPYIWQWGRQYASVLPGDTPSAKFRPFLEVDWKPAKGKPTDYDSAHSRDEHSDAIVQSMAVLLRSMLSDPEIAAIYDAHSINDHNYAIQVWKNNAPEDAPPRSRSSYHAYVLNMEFPMRYIKVWKRLVEERNASHPIPDHRYDTAPYAPHLSLRVPTSANKDRYVMYPIVITTLIGSSLLNPDDAFEFGGTTGGIRGDVHDMAPVWMQLVNFNVGGLIAADYGLEGEAVVAQGAGRPRKAIGAERDLSDNLVDVVTNDSDQIRLTGDVALVQEFVHHMLEGAPDDLYEGSATRESISDAIAQAVVRASVGSKRARDTGALAASAGNDKQLAAARWVLQNRIGKVGIANTIEKAPVDVRNADIIKIDELEYGVAFTANTTWCMIKGDRHRTNKLHVVMTPNMLWCQCFSAKCREKLQNVLGNQAQTHSGLPVFWGPGAVKPVFNRPFRGFVVDKPRSTKEEQAIADKLALYGSFDDDD